MARKTKKKKKVSVKSLKIKLWELVKKVARKKYGNRCFTCGKGGLSGCDQQTGHFLPSSTCGAYLRYDLRNLRIQCMRCNVHGGGQGAVFYTRLVETEGQEYVDQLFRDKNKIVKADEIFYLNKIKEFEDMI